MSPKFNIDRPKISDEELNKHQDFDKLVKQFKEQSLKQAQGDESWWKNKKIRYSTVIAGITVICTITYFSLFKKEKQNNTAHETVITQKTSPAQTKFINEPSSKIKINYSRYTVNNAAGGSISHSTASKINIPKNSFVDKNGHDIVGDVTIEYKEFHDLGDVIASGIPMAYDSAGTKYNLESAGMFDIRGTQNGEAVFINPDKPLQVELASRNPENRFNQYYLDTVSRNWSYIKKDELLKPNADGSVAKRKAQFVPNKEDLVALNPKLQALKNDVEVVLPKKIDSVKTVYHAKVEKLSNPKTPAKPAKASGRPSFQLEASSAEFPELQAFKNAVFEVGAENRNYSKDLHDITWSSVSVSQGPEKGKNYLLTLVYRNRTEKLIVYPVLTGADYERSLSLYEQKLDIYNQLLEKRQADEKRLIAEMQAKQAAYMAEIEKKEAQYKAERLNLLSKQEMEGRNALASGFNTMSNQERTTRLFSVSRFGVYNSDCPHTFPQGASTEPVFVMNAKDKAVLPTYVYLVDHGLRSVYNINVQNGYRLSYTPGGDYSICIIANNQLFTCSKEKFKQAVEKGNNHFEVAPLPDPDTNLETFKKALEI